MSRIQDYRLRAFEAAYVRPHLDFLEQYDGNEWPWRDLYEYVAPFSEASIRLFLLVEAAAWIDLGKDALYFSDDLLPLLEQSHRAGSIRDLSYLGAEDTTFVVEKGWQSDLHGPFDEVLLNAMEDLTRDRQEFLRLYLFAEEAEWRDRVGQLEFFLQTLQRSRLNRFPEEELDTVSWAFTGPETTLHVAGLPCDWRSVSLSDIPEAEEAEEADDRARTLRNLRSGIEAYVHSLLNRDLATARLREQRQWPGPWWVGGGTADD